jgi:hypothetical protein
MGLRRLAEMAPDLRFPGLCGFGDGVDVSLDGLPGTHPVDRLEQAVDLAALDGFEGLQAAEGGVGFFEPDPDVLLPHAVGEAVEEATRGDERARERTQVGAGLPRGGFVGESARRLRIARRRSKKPLLP